MVIPDRLIHEVPIYCKIGIFILSIRKIHKGAPT
jgi:hypothetical protein